MKRCSLFFLFTLYTLLCIGQSKNSLHLNVFPKNAFVLINDSIVTSSSVLNLQDSIVYIKIWAPNYKPHLDTINLNHQKIYTKSLFFADEYKLFQRTENKYRTGTAIRKGILGTNLAIIGVLGVLSYYSYSNLNKEKAYGQEKLLLAQNSYNQYLNATTTYEVNTYKAQYNLYYNEYSQSIDLQHRKTYNFQLTLINVGVSTATYFLLKSLYKTKPLMRGKSYSQNKPNWVK